MQYTAENNGRNGFSAILIVTALMLVGIACIPMLEVHYTPRQRSRQLSVSFYYQAPAKAVESEVTRVIESAVNTVPGISSLDTRTWQGGGSVSVSFKENVDMHAAKAQVSACLRQIQKSLPKGVYTNVDGTGGSANERSTVLLYTLNSDMPQSELVRLVQERIAPHLSRIDGVTEVGTSGTMPFEWVLKYDPDRLEASGLSVNDLYYAIGNRFSNRIAGTCLSNGRNMLVWLNSPPFDGIFDDIPLPSADGHVYSLADFTKVIHCEQDAYSYERINGLDAIGMYVNVSDNANMVKVAADVKKRMESLNQVLPGNVGVELAYDASVRLNTEIRKMFFRALLSLAILFLMVLLSSRNIRYMLVIGLSVIATMLLSVPLYLLLDIDIELYSMAGISVSLGIVIDTAIVVADHYRRHCNLRVLWPVTGAVLTSVAALMAILLLPEQSRENLTDFARIITVNLCVSVIVAFVFVPALSNGLSAAGKREKRHSIGNLRRRAGAVSGYMRTVALLRKRRWIVLACMSLLFVLALWLFNASGKGHIDVRRNGTEDKSLNISVSMPHGGSTGQLNDIVRDVEKFIAGLSGVMDFRTSISGTDASIRIRFNDGDIDDSYRLSVKDSLWHKALGYGGVVWHMPSLGLGDEYLTNDVIRTQWTNTVNLCGYNYDRLYTYAMELTDSLKTLKRVTDAGFAFGPSYQADDEIFLNYDKERMTGLGVDAYAHSVLLMSRSVDWTVGQTSAEKTPEFIRIKSVSTDDNDIWSLMNRPVTIAGRQLRLNQFGGLEKKHTGMDIVRENQEYRIAVGYEFQGSFAQRYEIVGKQLERIDKKFPLGFHIDSSGYSFMNGKEKRQRYLVVLAVIASIFMILSAIFESFMIPFAIMLLVPLSLIGLFIVYPLTGVDPGQGGFAAAIMLCGITVNAGIYLAWEYYTSHSMSYRKAVKVKITPVMLTIISTVLGLVPFLLDKDADGFWFSFAVGVMAGMLFSIIALLFIMPLFLPICRRHANTATECW